MNKMETKLVYRDAKSKTDLPSALLFYLVKDENGVVQIGNSLPISFSDEELSVKRMKEIESKPGFMFWNHSPEGKEWFDTNEEVVQKMFKNYILGVTGFGPKTSKN